MTPRTPSLLCISLPLLALGLACGGGTGKSTSDASASSGAADSSSTATTAATTTVTGGQPSTSEASASNTASSSSGQATTGASSSSTSVATTSTSTSTSTTGDSSTTTTTTTTTTTGGEQCQGQGASCAGIGALCCQGLECCAGVPVPEGKEFCSDNCPISDRNLKTDFAEIDAAQVLARVVALPISTWRYRKDSAEVRHLGPMAQDFHAAFGLWNTDTMIFPLDASGVSFAAIQALNTRLVAAEAENEALRARLDRLEQTLDR